MINNIHTVAKTYRVSQKKLLILCLKWWLIFITVFSPYLLSLFIDNNYSKLIIDLSVTLLVMPLVYILFSREIVMDKSSQTLKLRNQLLKHDINELSIQGIVRIKLDWSWILGTRGNVLNITIREYHNELNLNDALFEKDHLKNLLRNLLKENTNIKTGQYVIDFLEKTNRSLS